ncbi:MAG: RNA polymerase sigma-70 factor, partial [Solirubrobacterales bacterium]|nr:RNA polymerase sigma-70 factor [Solirubrobacterales bacterium]
IGPWLPDPLVETPSSEPDPADRVTLDESVSHALLVVLESLSPAERTAFVLHDVFGFAFEEVGVIVGRSPASTRQLASRARRHVEEQRPRYPASLDQQRSVVAAFTAAVGDGDLDGLLALLDPDVVLRSDGGGLVNAARKPILGADRVGRSLLAFARKGRGSSQVRFVDVNGMPGLLIAEASGILTVTAFTIDGGRIVALDVVRNPEKLRHVQGVR